MRCLRKAFHGRLRARTYQLAALASMLFLIDSGGREGLSKSQCDTIDASWKAAAHDLTDYVRTADRFQLAIMSLPNTNARRTVFANIFFWDGDALMKPPVIVTDKLNDVPDVVQQFNLLERDLAQLAAAFHDHLVFDRPHGTPVRVDIASSYIVDFYEAPVKQPSQAWSNAFGSKAAQVNSRIRTLNKTIKDDLKQCEASNEGAHG